MNITYKSALGALVFFLALWLWFDSSSTGSTKKRIGNAIISGEVGGLSVAEQEKFSSLLIAMFRDGGYQGEITVNQTVDLKYLNIYTTTDVGNGRRICQRGNAIYDASIDAIFIDVDLLRDSGFESISPFLAFVLLHELGHRQLHRASAGMFDVGESPNASSQKLEDEADEFAFNKLKAIADTGEYLADNRGFAIEFGDQDRTPDQYFSQWMLYSLVDFLESTRISPFYSDSAHRNLPQRANILLSKISGGAEVSAVSAFVESLLTAADRTSELLAGEVRVAGKVVKTCWSPSKLFLITEEGQLFFVDKKIFEESSTIRNTVATPLGSCFVSKNSIDQLFVTGNEIYLIDDQGVAFNFQENAWQQVRTFGSPVAEGFPHDQKYCTYEYSNERRWFPTDTSLFVFKSGDVKEISFKDLFQKVFGQDLENSPQIHSGLTPGSLILLRRVDAIPPDKTELKISKGDRAEDLVRIASAISDSQVLFPGHRLQAYSSWARELESLNECEMESFQFVEVNIEDLSVLSEFFLSRPTDSGWPYLFRTESNGQLLLVETFGGADESIACRSFSDQGLKLIARGADYLLPVDILDGSDLQHWDRGPFESLIMASPTFGIIKFRGGDFFELDVNKKTISKLFFWNQNIGFEISVDGEGHMAFHDSDTEGDSVVYILDAANR